MEKNIQKQQNIQVYPNKYLFRQENAETKERKIGLLLLCHNTSFNIHMDNTNLVEYILRQIEHEALISEVIIIHDLSTLSKIGDIIKTIQSTKVKRLYTKSVSLKDSISGALGFTNGWDVVLLHESSRILMGNYMLNQALKAVEEYGSAFPIYNLSSIIEVQSPQVFKKTFFLDILAKNIPNITQISELYDIAKNSINIGTFKGSACNVKILTQTDAYKVCELLGKGV